MIVVIQIVDLYFIFAIKSQYTKKFKNISYVNMKKPLIRIGTDKLVNETTLRKSHGFDVLFGENDYYFVHIEDDTSWDVVNGTWLGSMGYLMNDTSFFCGLETVGGVGIKLKHMRSLTDQFSSQ